MLNWKVKCYLRIFCCVSRIPPDWNWHFLDWSCDWLSSHFLKFIYFLFYFLENFPSFPFNSKIFMISFLLFLIIRVSGGLVFLRVCFETGSRIRSWPAWHCVARNDLELDSAALALVLTRRVPARLFLLCCWSNLGSLHTSQTVYQLSYILLPCSPFRDRASLSSPGWLRIHYVHKASCKLRAVLLPLPLKPGGAGVCLSYFLILHLLLVQSLLSLRIFQFKNLCLVLLGVLHCFFTLTAVSSLLGTVHHVPIVLCLFVCSFM